jgi:hypothetical protein
VRDSIAGSVSLADVILAPNKVMIPLIKSDCEENPRSSRQSKQGLRSKLVSSGRPLSGASMSPLHNMPARLGEVEALCKTCRRRRELRAWSTEEKHKLTDTAEFTSPGRDSMARLVRSKMRMSSKVWRRAISSRSSERRTRALRLLNFSR